MSDAAKVKNVSGESLTVPRLGGRLVLDGAVVEVPVEDVFSYTSQSETWSPHDTAAKKAHKDAVAALEKAQAAEAAARGAHFDPGPTDTEPAPDDEPDTNPDQLADAGTQED